MACLRDPGKRECCHWQHRMNRAVRRCCNGVTIRTDQMERNVLHCCDYSNLHIRDTTSAPSSTFPPSDPRACSPLGRRSTLLQALLTPPLPMDSPRNLSLANSYSFLANRSRNHTRNHLSKHNSHSISTHGLHIFPHLDSGHHHFLDRFMRFP